MNPVLRLDLMLVRVFQLAIFSVMVAGTGGTRCFAQGATAPLSLFINGGGSASPLTNGEVLKVGQEYSLVAHPDPGFAFESWQPVKVFTTTTFLVDPSGNTNALVSLVVSPIPAYTNQPSLDFTMQPVGVIFDSPGVRTITQSTGWQANFVPIVLNIQRRGSVVILTWTNSSCTLQVAPAPGATCTNIPGAVSPYTNSIWAPAQYFRLLSG